MIRSSDTLQINPCLNKYWQNPASKFPVCETQSVGEDISEFNFGENNEIEMRREYKNLTNVFNIIRLHRCFTEPSSTFIFPDTTTTIKNFLEDYFIHEIDSELQYFKPIPKKKFTIYANIVSVKKSLPKVFPLE
jgi:hypothetical protein